MRDSHCWFAHLKPNNPHVMPDKQVVGLSLSSNSCHKYRRHSPEMHGHRFMMYSLRVSFPITSHNCHNIRDKITWKYLCSNVMVRIRDRMLRSMLEVACSTLMHRQDNRRWLCPYMHYILMITECIRSYRIHIYSNLGVNRINHQSVWRKAPRTQCNLPQQGQLIPSRHHLKVRITNSRFHNIQLVNRFDMRSDLPMVIGSNCWRMPHMHCYLMAPFNHRTLQLIVYKGVDLRLSWSTLTHNFICLLLV